MYRTSPKFRRLEHLIANDVPAQAEILSYLGPSLAQIFNDYSNETTRTLLGVTPPLKGPVDKELWISPSDRLVGKVAFKPPLSDKYTKACTHQGILGFPSLLSNFNASIYNLIGTTIHLIKLYVEIGEHAALKFEQDTESKIRQKLEEEMKEIRKMFEAEKRRDIELSVEETRNEYEKKIQLIEKQVALEKAAEKSWKETQKAILRERCTVELEMMKKLRDEVGNVVSLLNDEFQLAFQAQRDNMVADFNAIMRHERKIDDARLRFHQLKKAEELNAQHYQYQAQKISDIAIIVCTERMRCRSEMQAMRQCFEQQIAALQKLVIEAPENIEESEVMNEPEADREIPNRSDDDPKLFQVVEVLDHNGNLWRPIFLEPEVPRLNCANEEPTLPFVSSAVNFFPPDQYTATDRVSQSSAQTLHSYDSLPFCYYKDKLYVRSDYREKSSAKKPVIEEKKVSDNEIPRVASFVMELKKSKSCPRK
ncbi:uncharacterized protein [Venturia canescens]|uniref:uncharacterized protein n=1 Tax=Venturia canescens TaxID=32260 RepID=UPI001C9C9932|nr:uncharacterized protein LOC122415246 [Venturia canescens]